MANKQFEEVSIPMWKLVGKDTEGKTYRVYKSASEFEEIEAASATEAIQKSGIEDVYEIRMGVMDDISVYDQSHLTEIPQEILDEIPIEANAAATSEAPAA